MAGLPEFGAIFLHWETAGQVAAGRGREGPLRHVLSGGINPTDRVIVRIDTPNLGAVGRDLYGAALEEARATQVGAVCGGCRENGRDDDGGKALEENRKGIQLRFHEHGIGPRGGVWRQNSSKRRTGEMTASFLLHRS